MNDNDISAILDKYGTGLEETRKLLPELITAVKARKRAKPPEYPWLKTTQFFTAEEAKGLGIDIEQGWKLKLSPDESALGFAPSLISPEGWEILQDQSWLSPEGEKYTLEDIQTKFADEYYAGVEGFGVEDLEQMLAGEMPVPERIRLEEKLSALKFEQAFGKVFPEQDIDEIFVWLGESDENLDQFIGELQGIGRTEDTERLLRSMFTGITEENLDEFFGAPAEEAISGIAITEQGDYIPEPVIKNIWDAFYLGARRLWHQTGQFFTSTLPNQLIQDVKPGMRISMGPFATTITQAGMEISPRQMGIAPQPPFYFSYLTEEQAETINQYNKEQRDKFRQIYTRNQDVYEDWLEDHPELKPPPNYEEGITEHPELIKDAGYWGWCIADASAYTLSVLGVTLGVGFVTRSPYLALAAGTAVATPAASQDLYEDLLASGAPEDEAANIAVPVGVFIASIEAITDLPLLKAISPAFNILKGNIQKAVVKQTVGGLLKKGVKTFATIEIVETMEEIAQGAIHNAFVKFYDENREIFGGMDDTIIRTLIATLPFALFGGGMTMRHVSPDVANTTPDEQKRSLGWEQDKLTGEWYEPVAMVDFYNDLVTELKEAGAKIDQAKLKALNEVAKTPEGEKAISNFVEELKEGVKMPEKVETNWKKALKEADDTMVALEIGRLRPDLTVDTKEYQDFIDSEIIRIANKYGVPEGILRKQTLWEPSPPAAERRTPLTEAEIDELIAGIKPKLLIPKAEPGMPEAGLQPSMIEGVPAREVRPKPKAEIVQASMDDYLKLKKYEAKEASNRIEEIKTLLETKGKLPVGQGTKEQLRIELARLEVQKELAEIKTFEELESAIEGIRNELGNRSLPYHGGAPNLYPEYTTKQLDEMLKVYEEARNKLMPPLPITEPKVKAREVVPFIPGTSLSIKQIDATLSLFGQAIVSPDAASQRLATIELRKHHLAQRARAYAARVEELIIEGKGLEEAMTLARQETMSGKLPEVTTDYYDDLTQEMRDVLFAKVHHYWKAIEPDTFEEVSTITALTNALAGKSISRKRGTGTRAFPQGGSAWDRLARTFADHPQILEALDQQKSLGDMIEGIFLEAGRQALPLDQKTVDYLKGLATLTEEDRLMFEKPLKELKVEEIRRIAEQEYHRRKRELDRLLSEGRIDQSEYDIELRIAKDKVYPYPAVTIPELPTGRAFGQARLGEEPFVPTRISERKTAEQIAKETAELRVEIAPPPSPVTRFEPPIEDAFNQLPMLTFKEKKNIVRILKDMGLGVIDIGNFLRANKASCDFSFWRQSKLLAAGHPIAFYRANIEAWNAMWSQKAAEANWLRITQDPDFELYERIRKEIGADPLRIFEAPKGTAQWRAAEEMGYLTGERAIPRFTAKIPWIKWSGRSFVAGCNTIVWDVWKVKLKAARREALRIASGEKKLAEGEAFNIEKDMTDHQKMLADFTQRASLGKASPLAPALGSMFFAPRSKLGRLLAPRHLISSNPRVRAEAWKDFSLFIGGMSGLVMLGAWLGLWDVEDDPRNAEFMSIRIGNMRIDPWAGYRQFLVLYTRLITGTGISSVTGKEYEADPIRALTSFFRTSLAPLPAILLDFWTGKNFIGEEVNVADKRQWLERIAPFAVWDFWEAYEDDWHHGAIAILPAIFGEGVQTYTGDWVENWTKLGLPKYLENTAYGLTEPTYDAGDFWSDTAYQFKGVDPATLTEEKGFPPYIRAIVEALVILEQLDLLPNKKLISINADPDKGATFVEYYQMWRDREKLVASGDEEALKAFDADERTRNAHLGNMTQRQFALLVEYHSLPEAEKEQFLKDHPEIAIDTRDEWLKAHPLENAKLAIWGKAKLLSMEAYEHMQQMIKDLDIPDSAVPELTLPPKECVENYFKYREAGEEYGYNSAEARLIVAEDDVLREWLGRQDITTPVESLEISVKWREMDDQYEALDPDDRPTFLEANPDYADDRRRRDAYGIGLGDTLIEDYVEWHKTERKGYVDDWFLMEHKDFYDTMVELGQLKERDFSKVPDIKYKELWVDWVDQDAEYDALVGDDKQTYLENNAEYRKVRRKRQGIEYGLPDNVLDDYVDYYEVPPKSSDPWYIDNPGESYYGDDWFLMEHPELYQAMIDPEIMGDNVWQPRDFSKVPTKEVFKLYRIYKGLPLGQPRLDYRAKHPELDEWLVLAKGYMPVGDKGDPNAPKTPWEEQEEIEEFIESPIWDFPLPNL